MTTYQIHYIDNATGEKWTTKVQAENIDMAKGTILGQFALFAITITRIVAGV